jgi:hypothetical protein
MNRFCFDQNQGWSAVDQKFLICVLWDAGRRVAVLKAVQSDCPDATAHNFWTRLPSAAYLRLLWNQWPLPPDKPL